MIEIVSPILAAGVLLFISHKDITEGIVPDWAVILCGILALPKLLESGDIYPILSALILCVTSLALRFIFQKLKDIPGIGLGDVKLLAAIGLWIHPFMIPQFLIICGILGVATHFIWARQKQLTPRISTQWGEAFPFAPAMSISWLFIYLLKFVTKKIILQ